MNGLFMAPAEDRLGRVLTEPIEAATSKFYGITRAAMVNGKQADDIDAFDDWQMSDSGYYEIVAEAADLFVENSAHTSPIEKMS